MTGKIKIFAILILIFGIIASCGGKKEGTPAKDGETKTEGTEITLMIPDWGAPTEEMLAEFKAETGITVKVYGIHNLIEVFINYKKNFYEDFLL